MRSLFRITQFNLVITGKQGYVSFEKPWNKFLQSYNENNDETSEVSSVELLNEKMENPLEIYHVGNAKYFFRYNNTILLSDYSWKRCHIIFREFEDIDFMLSKIFYTHAVQHHMIQFHSSLIDYQGHGLMFLGPSGIGKTTQAELWNKYRDALIINGDIVFVQETEEAFLGWGTPWHGSSPYCENTNVPVEALIILKQAPENSIRKLEGFEKVTAVSNSVFYPRWLENGMELCLETLDHLLSKIPVYELSCRPDEEAVELTEKTIFGREH